MLQSKHTLQTDMERWNKDRCSGQKWMRKAVSHHSGDVHRKLETSSKMFIKKMGKIWILHVDNIEVPENETKT